MARALDTYVKTKQEILFESHQASMDFGQRALDDAIKRGGSAADIVETYIKSSVGSIAREDGFFAILGDIDAPHAKDRAVIVARSDTFEKRLQKLLGSGVKDGSLEPADPTVIIFTFIGAFHWTARWFKADGRLSEVEFRRQLSDLLMRGLVRRAQKPRMIK